MIKKIEMQDMVEGEIYVFPQEDENPGDGIYSRRTVKNTVSEKDGLGSGYAVYKDGYTHQTKVFRTDITLKNRKWIEIPTKTELKEYEQAKILYHLTK